MHFLCVQSNLLELASDSAGAEEWRPLLDTESVSVFVAIDADEESLGTGSDHVVSEALALATDVDASRLLLHPFPSGAETPASPDRHRTVLESVEDAVGGRFEVHVLPADWNAGSTVRCGRHSITSLLTGRATDGAETSGPVRFRTANGDLVDRTDDESLRSNRDRLHDRPSDDVPAGVTLLREKGWAASDRFESVRDLRWSPTGTVLLDAIRGSVRHDLQQADVYPLALDPDDDLADGLRRYLSGEFLSTTDLPLRVYDPTAERRAARIVLSVTDSVEAAVEECLHQFGVVEDLADTFGVEYDLRLQVPGPHLDSGLDLSLAYVGAHDGAIPVEIPDGEPPDWMVRAVFEPAADRSSLGGPIVQVERPTTSFDVVDPDGEGSDEPLFVRSVVTESAADLAVAALGIAENREPPRLDPWAAPTQVRLIPVAAPHADFCLDVAESLRAKGIRADIDDRDESVGKRVASAETSWVPYYGVVGDRELEDGIVEMTVRGRSEDEPVAVDDLASLLTDDVAGHAHETSMLPASLADRPGLV